MKKILSQVLIVSCSLTANAQRTDGLPISVKVNTAVNFPGGTAELSGVSNTLDKEPGQVFIDIKTPAGSMDHISTRADKKTGSYLVKYTCKALGKYAVTAYASDKKQSATAGFSVTAMSSATTEFADFSKNEKKVVQAVESAADAAAKTGGDAEDISKVKEQVEKMKENVAQFDKALTSLKTAVDDVNELTKAAPEINEVTAPELGELASELEEKSADLLQAEKMLNDSKSEADVCKQLYGVSEGCAAFSTYLNVTSGGLKSIAEAIFVDKVWPVIEQKFAPKSFDSKDNFLFQQAGKAGLTAKGDFDALKESSNVKGVASDLQQFVTNELFKKYCTEYKGPVIGTYEVETKNEGKTYMKYKLTYEGTISVFGKTSNVKSSSSPKLSGYFEGNVTNMDFTDDVWAVEKKDDWEELKYERIPAPVAPFNASDKDPGFGAAARAALPGSFYFPIDAQIQQGMLIIKLKPAYSDFTAAFQNRSVVVVRAVKEPHNYDGAVFSYPMQDAHFILTRTMRMPDDKPVVSLPLKTGTGTGTTVDKEFNRSESPTGDITVNFDLKISMSNQ